MSAPVACVIVPCYNEQRRLRTDEFQAFAASHPDLRFVFVNDGSRDGTLAVLEKLRSHVPDRIAVLNLEKNRGKAEAVRAGLVFGLSTFNPQYVGFWDADLATPLFSIDSFVELLNGHDELLAVIGSRVRLLGRHIERRLVRHILGRAFATAASIVLQLPVYDTQCGAKLFRNTPALQTAINEPFASRWIFDVELIARLSCLQGLDAVEGGIYEYPLEKWTDIAGSAVRPGDFFTAFFELLRIWTRYSRRSHRRGNVNSDASACR